MMRRIVTLCVVMAATAAASAESREVEGVWIASVSETDPGRLDLSLRTDRSDQNGSYFAISELHGLTSAQIRSDTRVPVAFELRREAGTIAFEGTFRDERGAGEFTFTPDPGYPELLRSLGLELETSRQPEERELLNLTLFDLTVSFIRSMRAIGYDVPLGKYVEFRIFGVDPDYVREMRDVGFDRLSADKLVETKIHGATPEYIREMRASGEDLPLNQYIESRIFRVTPEFADEMARAGYSGLNRKRLVEFKIHGVTTDFIHELKTLGYSKLPAEKLVEMKIHGVTPEFIREVEAAGYRNVPVDKLVQMRIFNIDPKMVRALDDDSR